MYISVFSVNALNPVCLIVVTMLLVVFIRDKLVMLHPVVSACFSVLLVNKFLSTMTPSLYLFSCPLNAFNRPLLPNTTNKFGCTPSTPRKN